MSERRRRLVGRKSRYVLLGVALAMVGLLAMSFLLSDTGIEEAEANAEARAVRYAEEFLFDELTPDLASRDIVGSSYRDLLLLVQAGVLSDDRVVRVRIWKAGGDLVFSTAQRDRIEDYVAIDHPQIVQASTGVTASVAGPKFEPKGGLEGSDELLYATFVPLRLQGDDVSPFGVVEIDQRYSAIEEAAKRIWRLVQMFLILALVGFAGVSAIALRTTPGAEPAPSRPPRPARHERRRLDEEATTPSSEDAVPSSEHAALEAVRKRLGELELKLRAEEAEREQFAGEIQLLRAALAEKEAELARRAHEGEAAASQAETARSRRIAELESALAEAERRSSEADERRAAAATTERRTAEETAATARDEGRKKANAEAKKAQLEAKELRLKLAEAEAANAGLATAIAASEEAKAAAEEAKAEARRAKEEAAAVAADSEETKLELARAMLDVDRLQEELERAAAETDRWRARASATPGTDDGGTAATVETGDGDANAQGRDADTSGDLAALEARIAEMESHRRSDVEELQRAQASLANTQFELIEATRKLKQSQERIRELEGGVVPASAPRPEAAAPRSERRPRRSDRDESAPADVTRQAEDETPLEVPSVASVPSLSRATGSRPEGSAQGAPGGEEPEAEQEDEDEAGLSLRERLTRAAAARHRGPGPSSP